jgi:hypothetical protein
MLLTEISGDSIIVFELNRLLPFVLIFLLILVLLYRNHLELQEAGLANMSREWQRTMEFFILFLLAPIALRYLGTIPDIKVSKETMQYGSEILRFLLLLGFFWASLKRPIHPANNIVLLLAIPALLPLVERALRGHFYTLYRLYSDSELYSKIWGTGSFFSDTLLLLRACLASYFIYFGALGFIYKLWVNPNRSKADPDNWLSRLRPPFGRQVWLILVLAVVTAAYPIWSYFDWIGNLQETKRLARDYYMNFYLSGLTYTFQLRLWFIVIVGLIGLLRAWSRIRPSVFFPKLPLTDRSPRPQITLLAFLFATGVVGMKGLYWGVFYFPLAFIIGFLFVRYLVVSTWLERAEVAAIRYNPVAVEKLGTPLLVQCRVSLLDASRELNALRSQLKTLESERTAGGLNHEEYVKKRRDIRYEIRRLKRQWEWLPEDESEPKEEATRTWWRRLLERIRNSPREPSADGTIVVEMPEESSPGDLGLGTGPKDTWWSNGIAAARTGAKVALIPISFYAYQSFRELGSPVGLLSDSYGVLRIIMWVLEEAAFWLAASFVLGCLWSYLRGRRGPIKGVLLGSTYLIAQGFHSGACLLLRQPVDKSLFLRALLLIVFLSLVGAAMDSAALDAIGAKWTDLISLYELNDVRTALTYATSIAIAAVGIWQQIRAGNAAEQQATEAIARGLRSLQEAVPH